MGKVITIVGPTCSGKTGLGIILAQKLDGEIISADSRQVYKFLDIGTATPTPEELKTIPHYFINKLDPREEFNVSIFEKEGLKLIKGFFDREKFPVIVGGSGLYIRAIIDGITDLVDTDEDYRFELQELRKANGNEYLFNLLNSVDPKTANTMLPQNWKRVIRALEVFHLTGKSILDLHKEYSRKDNYEFLQIGLHWDREILYKNIEMRVDQMIKMGLVDEVRKVLDLGYETDCNALNTVGYKEIISFLNGQYNFDRAIELIKRNTRRYAKRQMTWFNKDKRINWIDVKNETDFRLVSQKIISEYLQKD